MELAITHTKKDFKLKHQVFDLVDGVGTFIEYWGFKKIHGRIWALIFLAERPVDASYLVKHLGVSKALVSMSIKDLLDYNVIQEAPKQDGKAHYLSNTDLAKVISDVLVAREAKMILNIKSSCQLLSRMETQDLQPLATKKRITKLGQMVSTADKALAALITLKQINFKNLSQSMSLKNGLKGS